MVGVLIAEILVMRKRLDALEQRAPGELQAGKVEQEVVFTPVSPLAQPQSDDTPSLRPRTATAGGMSTAFSGKASSDNRKASSVDRFFAGLGQDFPGFFSKIKDFFSTGNVVLKLGVIIIFLVWPSC